MNKVSGTVSPNMCNSFNAREVRLELDCGGPHPTIECTCGCECRYVTLYEYLVEQSLPIDGGAALADSNSVQYAAFQFIDGNGDWEAFNDTGRILQRYAVATLGASGGFFPLENLFFEQETGPSMECQPARSEGPDGGGGGSIIEEPGPPPDGIPGRALMRFGSNGNNSDVPFMYTSQQAAFRSGLNTEYPTWEDGDSSRFRSERSLRDGGGPSIINILCDSNDEVTLIATSRTPFDGSLPPEVGLFTSLGELFVPIVSFHCDFSDFQLGSAAILDLSHSVLQGSIPSTIGWLTTLGA